MQKRFFSSSCNLFANVGFIGLGNMGKGMANNLIAAGHKLTVYDISATAAKEELKGKGAKIATSVSQLASQSDIDAIVTMLPSSPHVKEVYCGNQGILKSFSNSNSNNSNGAGKKRELLLLDSSTIDPTSARAVATEAAAAGVVMVDCPVSGGTAAAEKGTLTFMVGGSVEGFERANVFLKSMGKNIVHCGPSGAGQITKVCNNMVLAISMIGVSEAMNIGVKLGMDPKVLAGVINTSSGRCWSSDTYNPVPGVMDGVPASRNYTGGFMTDLMKKDLGLATDAAAAAKTPIPLGSAALQIYTLLSNQGYGSADFSVIYKFLADHH